MKRKFTTTILIVFAFVMMGLSTQAEIWTQKANYGGTGRMNPCCFSIGTVAYVGLGNDNNNSPDYPQDFWAWNQSSNSWTQIASFPGSGREGGIGFSTSTKGYAGMGYNGASNIYYGDLYSYTPGNNSWAALNGFPGGVREFATCVTINSIPYVGCGFYQFGFSSYNLNDFYAYNAANDTWTQKANFPYARSAAFGFAIDTLGYIGAGDSSYYPFLSNVVEFFAYSPTTNTWTRKANFPNAVAGGGAFTLNNKGYAGLGVDNNANYHSDFYEYDPVGNTWTQVASCGISDFVCNAFTIGAKGYIAGGVNGSSTPLKALWEYQGGSAGINEISNEQQISVYPIPASTILNIHISNFTAHENIVITNITGKIVYNETLTGIDNSIATSTWSAGVYFYEIRSNNSSVRGKFVKGN